MTQCRVIPAPRGIVPSEKVETKVETKADRYRIIETTNGTYLIQKEVEVVGGGWPWSKNEPEKVWKGLSNYGFASSATERGMWKFYGSFCEAKRHLHLIRRGSRVVYEFPPKKAKR